MASALTAVAATISVPGSGTVTVQPPVNTMWKLGHRAGFPSSGVTINLTNGTNILLVSSIDGPGHLAGVFVTNGVYLSYVNTNSGATVEFYAYLDLTAASPTATPSVKLVSLAAAAVQTIQPAVGRAHIYRVAASSLALGSMAMTDGTNLSSAGFYTVPGGTGSAYNFVSDNSRYMSFRNDDTMTGVYYLSYLDVDATILPVFTSLTQVAASARITVQPPAGSVYLIAVVSGGVNWTLTGAAGLGAGGKNSNDGMKLPTTNAAFASILNSQGATQYIGFGAINV